MPVLTLTCVIVAQMMRMTRAAVIDQLEAPYIEMVRLKGASPLRMVLAHALPNAVGPIANAVALSLSYLLGGVIIVETIFNYPGIAKLMVDGVTQRDMPLVQACAMLFCAGYLILVTHGRRVRHRRQPAAAAPMKRACHVDLDPQRPRSSRPAMRRCARAARALRRRSGCSAWR